MFAILILQALILQGGDNIEILPNPSVYSYRCLCVHESECVCMDVAMLYV